MRALYQLDRRLAVWRHRNAWLPRALPYAAVKWAARARAGLLRARAFAVPVERRSPHAHLFHCCVHKTGSQWITAVLADLATYRHCGLLRFYYQAWRPEGYDPRPIDERTFAEPFPARRIVSPLYIDLGNFKAVPKRGSYRAFFVQRDPRDVAVSWYFSARYSHLAMGDIARIRGELARMDKDDGIRHAIAYLDGHGLFTALGSWAEAPREDPNVLVVRYEDLAGPGGGEAFRRLYEHLDIRMPAAALAELIAAYSFRRLSGRRQGEADERSHVRKGGSGDWRNHFTEEMARDFDRLTGHLAERLGYDASVAGQRPGGAE